MASLLFPLAQDAQAFYNPQTGCWPNRDPLKEHGDINLYANSENNLVDYYDILGLWPGFKPCAKMSGPPDDSGWYYKAVVPDGPLPPRSGGISESDGIILIYKRTIKYKYECCSCSTDVKYRTYIYGEEVTLSGTGPSHALPGGATWGSPGSGGWPPLKVPDIIGDIIKDKVFGLPELEIPTLSKLVTLIKEYIPGSADHGKQYSDSGAPHSFCW